MASPSRAPTPTRRRGWRGDPPADDAEARTRILGAATVCIDRFGPKTSLSDVAAEAGVTRQTVYRHFTSIDDLFEAVARGAAVAFLDELADHLRELSDPADVLVEAIAYAVERLPDNPYLGLLLEPGRSAMWWRGVASPLAQQFGQAMLRRTPVDWSAHGYGPAELDGLVEYALRMLGSLTAEPDPRHARGEPLRGFLRRWVAPAVAGPPAQSPEPAADRRAKRGSEP